MKQRQIGRHIRDRQGREKGWEKTEIFPRNCNWPYKWQSLTVLPLEDTGLSVPLLDPWTMWIKHFCQTYFLLTIAKLRRWYFLVYIFIYTLLYIYIYIYIYIYKPMYSIKHCFHFCGFFHTCLHLFCLISHAIRPARCNFLLVYIAILCMLWATLSCKHILGNTNRHPLATSGINSHC